MASGDFDARQELLERIRTHQASIHAYVQKMRGRRELMTTISVVSSAVAAALTLGPAVGGERFSETVQHGLGWDSDSGVYRLLCFAALTVNLVAAISTALNKSNDHTEQIQTAEAGGAALEGLRTDIEFGKLPVRTAAAEYRQIVSRILFVVANATVGRDVDPYGEASTARTSLLSRIRAYWRRSAEVVIPGISLVFGSLVVGFVLLGLGRGIAVAGPEVGTVPALVVSPTQVRVGDAYSVAASGFAPGEALQISWSGPTTGTMGVFSADLTGHVVLSRIVEKEPPGAYAMTVIGQTSGRTTMAALKVFQPGS